MCLFLMDGGVSGEKEFRDQFTIDKNDDVILYKLISWTEGCGFFTYARGVSLDITQQQCSDRLQPAITKQELLDQVVRRGIHVHTSLITAESILVTCESPLKDETETVLLFSVRCNMKDFVAYNTNADAAVFNKITYIAKLTSKVVDFYYS